MKAGNLLFGSALLFVGYNLFQEKKNAKYLNFYPSNVENIGFDGLTPTATIGIVAQNPSNSQFVIRAITGNLTSNGYLIGNFSQFLDQIIQPTSSSVIYIDVRLSLLSVVNDLIKAFSTGSFSQQMEFKGTVNVDGFIQTLDINYKVGA